MLSEVTQTHRDKHHFPPVFVDPSAKSLDFSIQPEITIEVSKEERVHCRKESKDTL